MTGKTLEERVEALENALAETRAMTLIFALVLANDRAQGDRQFVSIDAWARGIVDDLHTAIDLPPMNGAWPSFEPMAPKLHQEVDRFEEVLLEAIRMGDP
jgi:hypothetical protein